MASAAAVPVTAFATVMAEWAGEWAVAAMAAAWAWTTVAIWFPWEVYVRIFRQMDGPRIVTELRPWQCLLKLRLKLMMNLLGTLQLVHPILMLILWWEGPSSKVKILMEVVL